MTAGVDSATALSAEEIVELSREYTLYDWSAQSKVAPLPVDHADGVYFYTVDGKRYLDFASQLMSVNVGHGHPAVIEAIQRQASKLAYISPFMAHEPRARLGKELAEILPGDIDKVFFTLGGAEANEHAIKIARMVTGRQKILARYRSYHGATGGAISLTGDPRRWVAEPGIPGVVHVLDPYHDPGQPVDSADRALAYLDEVIRLEGPQTIAAFILEPVTGTNGILIPPDGYLQGVRELCDRYGILLIADEVMTGFGRTGEWFAVDHWGVVPDLITLAKGLTSSYVPLGAVGMRHHIAEHFETSVFQTGLTYNSHPLACAAALANLQIYRDEGLIENSRRLGEVMAERHQNLQRRHPSVGAVRNIGLFGILELFRDRAGKEPLAPYNGSSPEIQVFNRRLLDLGLYTMVRWHTVMTNPPLTITEQELDDGFTIIDEALTVTDEAVTG